MFSDFIDHLIKEGKCCFNHQDAMSYLGKSKKAIQSSIEHLLSKNELASPVRGFYVILSPEYRKLGCLPAAFFLRACDKGSLINASLSTSSIWLT